jgi:NADH-quinone oxidoreductase subunit M
MFAAWSPAADRPLGLFRACAVLAVLGTGLAAAYSLRVLRTVWAGERTEPGLVDARGGELAVLGVLVVAVVALGILPGPLLQTTIADVTAITTPGSVVR